MFGPFGPSGPPDPRLINIAPKPDVFFLWMYAALAGHEEIAALFKEARAKK